MTADNKEINNKTIHAMIRSAICILWPCKSHIKKNVNLIKFVRCRINFDSKNDIRFWEDKR